MALVAELEIFMEAEPTRPRVSRPTLTALTIDDGGLDDCWRAARPARGQSFRWERGASDWVAIVVGQDEELGQLAVCDSHGQRHLVASYEDALKLARCWTL